MAAANGRPPGVRGQPPPETVVATQGRRGNGPVADGGAYSTFPMAGGCQEPDAAAIEGPGFGGRSRFERARTLSTIIETAR